MAITSSAKEMQIIGYVDLHGSSLIQGAHKNNKENFFFLGGLINMKMRDKVWCRLSLYIKLSSTKLQHLSSLVIDIYVLEFAY